MEQKQILERPRWITMTVPVLRYTIKSPKKISKLIYQMNLRGFRTGKIEWGEPILIQMKSHREFIDKVNESRRCGKREICDFFQFLMDDVDFKLNVHPYGPGKHEPVILTLVLKHSQIKKFEKLFYNAYIKHRPDAKKMEKKYTNQNLDEQPEIN